MDEAQPGPARFDAALRAWVLTSHEDVSAALREPRLGAVDSADRNAAHLAVRDAAASVLSLDRLAVWRPGFERSALDLAAALPGDRPVDLLLSFAEPWALSLALTVTGASRAGAADLARLARRVFLAAAAGIDGRDHPDALAAAAELGQRLPAAQAMINVQTFVALSQTLPHLLAGVWLELFADPVVTLRLRREPHLLPQALEELLRHAGPARAVYRHALANVRIGGANIGSGDLVVLMLAAANHDPARFSDPERVHVDRAARDHLAFGGGAHACSGTRLVRAAAAAGTRALLSTTETIDLVGPIEWIDGFAIRAPASLHAVLRRSAH